MLRVPSSGSPMLAPPRLYPKAENILDLAGLLSMISMRPNSRFYQEVNLHTAFVIVDVRMEDCPIVYTSTTFEELTGYREVECLGRNCRFLQGEASDKEVSKEIRRAVENGEEKRFQILNHRKDGTPFLNYLTIIPIFDNDKDRNMIYSLGIQSTTPWKIREIYVQPGESLEPFEDNISDDMDRQSAMSGFTGEVQESIQLFQARSGDLGILETQRDDQDDTFYTPVVSNEMQRENLSNISDPHIQRSSNNVRDKEYLRDILAQLSELKICAPYIERKARACRQGIDTRTDILELLAYISGLVDNCV